MGQELNFVFQLALPVMISGDTALSIFEFAGTLRILQPQYSIRVFLWKLLVIFTGNWFLCDR